MNFFDAIIDFVSMSWQMMCNAYSGLITTINIIYSSLSVPFALTMFVPSVIWASIVIVTSIGVVKLILSLIPG